MRSHERTTNGFAKWWRTYKSCSLVFQFSFIGLRTLVILLPPLRKAANVRQNTSPQSCLSQPGRLTYFCREPLYI